MSPPQFKSLYIDSKKHDQNSKEKDLSYKGPSTKEIFNRNSVVLEPICLNTRWLWLQTEECQSQGAINPKCPPKTQTSLQRGIMVKHQSNLSEREKDGDFWCVSLMMFLKPFPNCDTPTGKGPRLVTHSPPQGQGGTE